MHTRRPRRTRLHALLAGSLLLCAACGDPDSEDIDTTGADTSAADDVDIDTAPMMEAISIPFEVRAGAQSFSCDTALTGIGTTSAELTPTDMRLYVHAVELVADDGTVVPVALTDDDIWQDGTVALLDFEDGTGHCANGTAEMHTTIDGEVPAGMTWTGLRFVIGVPFELNHADPTLAESPLSYTSMHWGWQGGYKFIRFDSDTAHEGGWRVHLGSTGCMGEVGAITGCTRGNRPTVELTGFDLASSTVVLDLAALLADVDVTTNTADTAPGCMGAPDDPECGPVVEALGLSTETGEPTGSATVFSLQ